MTPTSYKVVCIPEFKKYPSTEFDIEIFSYCLGEWNTYQVSCPQQVIWDYGLRKNLVISNGVTYWIEGRNRIIAYDVTDNNIKNGGHGCRLINLPEKKGDDKKYYECLGESEGFVSYSRCENGELSVWLLEEDYLSRGWVWRLVHNIKIKDMILAENCDSWFMDKLASGEMVNLDTLAFNPVDPNVLILAYPISIIFAYNIRTRLLKVFVSYHHYLFVTYGAVPPLVLTPWPTTL
ncbi:hypothetical protein BVC80_901g47 [Macleaya cordata]|uniref:F-box protein At3g26010-like beta-propeller domain-containing protein n=1 Tax=Macleaya cordata TaxID=56857 RepID=A0A200QEP1_MACCD|nr:hypothetical protein BVC80_901g47 [Macleaya cordata]